MQPALAGSHNIHGADASTGGREPAIMNSPLNIYELPLFPLLLLLFLLFHGKEREDMGIKNKPLLEGKRRLWCRRRRDRTS